MAPYGTAGSHIWHAALGKRIFRVTEPIHNIRHGRRKNKINFVLI